MSALSWDTANHLTVPRLDQDCQEELPFGPRTLPNGRRVSGERRAEGDERVRCMRVLGGWTITRLRASYAYARNIRARLSPQTLDLPAYVRLAHRRLLRRQPESG